MDMDMDLDLDSGLPAVISPGLAEPPLALSNGVQVRVLLLLLLTAASLSLGCSQRVDWTNGRSCCGRS